MDIYYIDGQFVDDEIAAICVKDLAVIRGFGVFDFLITYSRRPFYLREHVKRLEISARCIGLEMKFSNERIEEIVEETLKKNGHHNESSIRIVYTGGVSSDGVTPEGNGVLIVMVTQRHIPPAWWYTEGAKIITVDAERFLPEAKSTNYLSAIYAQQNAKRNGGIEAVYVDRNNRILECTTSNIFFFCGGRLITPDSDILPGITRSIVLKLAEGRFGVELRDVDRSEIMSADEVFITASSKEIVPVVKVDGLSIGDGAVGKNTREMMRLFREYTTAYGEGKIK